MGTRDYIDRRQWPRYSLDFPVRVEGQDASGMTFVLTGRLCNISARGALANLPHRLRVGSEVRLDIAFPFSKSVWMSYDGEVVRTEPSMSGTNVAVKFIDPRPSFVEGEIDN